MTAPLTRAALAAVLAADGTLTGWEHYAEPPEQLAGRACMVVAPRSPYQSWQTYSELEVHLTISLLVPRTHGPAMDSIDTGLTALRAVLVDLEGVGIGDISSVGILEDVGAIQYIVASLDVDLT